MMIAQGMPVNNTPVSVRAPATLANSTPIVHSIKGYLAFCQHHMPELDIEVFLTGDDDYRLPDEEKFMSLAQIWKQCSQTFRRECDSDAIKNEPHPGEPGQRGYGSHPRLTPFETEGVLEALLKCDSEWNTEEDEP